ncbi:hypothetical protein PSCLAVI8L_60176 [Pseudoclavibacter sp. 8L]|nr:hypothetical protein PSCLAVI8L_60176 [Pseudoclavibacter sp. 8L]
MSDFILISNLSEWKDEATMSS